ncbi:hypothetical protein EY643_01570 [Halioglobus maricola]|uniref:Uncharacterized protein n=1 Tax=Halioglobus maricola TaxID=2601894 RepID=A0A5P9NFY1_9GAMM|nr:choice-of-anchor Q domain-containing protein [Halioglobus maricola]QFU74446.1 hypothetical protein EY643_01570 [Halioglobus maricola]
MRTNKKALLTLAVANASMALAMDASAATFTVTDSADTTDPGTLRHAIENAASGDTITIDVTSISTISLDSSLLASNKALILSAPVDTGGQPQVTIQPSSDGYRLLSLTNDSGTPIPFIVSGLEFSGADHSGIGGAISAQNHALVLDKSVITGNTASGVGGGVAVEAGELCLQGTSLTDNVVMGRANEGSPGHYAFGGGAAVNGIANMHPSGSDYGQNCLTSDHAQTFFTDSVSEGFAAEAAALDGNPDGVDIITSTISGNSAQITDTVIEGEDSKYAALGGGLAILKSDFEQSESVLARDCSGPGPGPGSSIQCNSIVGSAITGNSATVSLTAEEDPAKYSLASGGGVFIGTPGISTGQFLSLKYSDVSDNQITMTGSGAEEHDIAVGAGVGALNSDILYGISDFWDGLNLPEEGLSCDFGGPLSTCGNTVMVGTSTVTGNMITVELDAAETGENARDVVAGGGIGSVNLFDSERGLILESEGDEEEEEDFSEDFLYDTATQVISMLSTITGNSISVDATQEEISATGGGIAVGTALLDTPSFLPTELQYGKYLGIYSGNSGNEVDVVGGSALTGSVGGGGLNAAFQFINGKKPEYAIISDEEPEEKYGLPLSDAIFTSPGGIADNTVDVSVSSGDVYALVGGGGTFSDAKYSVVIGSSAQITGNQVLVDAGSGEGGEGGVYVGGGGSAQIPILEFGGAFSSWKYSKISDNSVTVSGGDGIVIEAFGGGLGISTDASGDGGELALAIEASEISGNSIDVTSSASASEVKGGGVSASFIGKYDDVPQIANTTVASNSISLSGGGGESGAVLGAGLYLRGEGEEGGIIHSTIAGNTGSYEGTPSGGQVFLDKNSSGYPLYNSIISGDISQGDKDVYYPTSDPDVSSTSVFHGDDSPLAGFLAPELADPAFLGALQFNGSDVVAGNDDDGGKYFEPGFAAETATISLLPGSRAIDTDGGCLSPDIFDEDQRGYPRDDCPDLGAYEHMAERDGDGLVDDAELSAAGTDPDILAGLDSYPAPYGIVLPDGDGNSDGFPDVDQAHVASFTHDTAGPLTLLVNDSEYDLSDVTPTAGMTAGGYDLSLGGVSFVVETGDDTDAVELSLIAPASPNDLRLVKQICNPAAPADPDDGWEVLDDSPEPFGADRVIFTFELEPDGPFDCNGSDPDIVDPIYIAESTPAAAPTADAVEPPVPVPVMPAILYTFLTGVMGMVGLRGIRSRRKKRTQ